jgi:hypothetical protein
VAASAPTADEMLTICAAVFGGDLARARLLADGPDVDSSG